LYVYTDHYVTNARSPRDRSIFTQTRANNTSGFLAL